MRWLGENYIPFTIVFTKADKIKEREIEKKVSDYLEKLKEDWESLPKYFITSSEKRLGRDELLGYIHEINESIPKF
jgi:GTP-binding protein